MRYIALVLLCAAACARARVQQPAATPVPDCYSLTYSDPAADATDQLFPKWIAIFPGTGKGHAVGVGMPAFLYPGPQNYNGWERLGADSILVRFTSTAEGVALHLTRTDSSVTGRAIWLTDVIGGPVASMRAAGKQVKCPAAVSSW